MTDINKNSAVAKVKNMRVSPRKLNYVAAFIRNMKASEAMVQLDFCKKRIAGDVKQCLRSAIANAENNNGLDIDNLVITEAVVGKALLMKRMMPRGRGRSGKIQKFFSNLRITVTEVEEK